jgi:hypothetical protein
VCRPNRHGWHRRTAVGCAQESPAGTRPVALLQPDHGTHRHSCERADAECDEPRPSEDAPLGKLRRHPVRVFLAARADAASIGSVRDPRLTPVGALHVDRRGRGELRFSVPNVAPGDYTTFLQCVPCRPGSGTRALVPSGRSARSLKIIDGPPVVRDCSTSVSGNLPADWQQYAVAAGPLTLYYWNASTLANPKAYNARAPNRYGPIKVLALVRGLMSVTLSVPFSERRNVALVYGPPSEWRDTMRVSDGHAATTFRGCSDSEVTQFNGGFIVAGTQCATFDVQVAARPDALKLAVPFGAAC